VGKKNKRLTAQTDLNPVEQNMLDTIRRDMRNRNVSLRIPCIAATLRLLIQEEFKRIKQ